MQIAGRGSEPAQLLARFADEAAARSAQEQGTRETMGGRRVFAYGLRSCCFVMAFPLANTNERTTWGSVFATSRVHFTSRQLHFEDTNGAAAAL